MADLVYTGKTPDSVLNQAAMPANVDIAIYKGDLVEIFVTLKNEQQVPMDLTGYTIRSTIKENYDGLEMAAFTCTTTAQPGEVRVYLPSSESARLVNKSYIWDFELVNADGDSRTYLTGDVTVTPEVTQNA